MKVAVALPVRTYIGLFLISLSLLVFELLLTRIFSVVLWYHFAFFAISIALFGLGAGGICLQLFPAWLPETSERLSRFLAYNCLALSLTMLFPVWILLRIHFPPYLLMSFSESTFLFLLVIFLFASIPFFFGGLITTALFKHFPHAIGRLYFSDLFGASMGCLLTFLWLEFFGGSTAILINAAFACLGAFCFLPGILPKKSRNILFFLTLSVFSCFIILAGYNTATASLEPKFVKGFDRSKDEFSKWNAISRVAVFDCETKAPAEWIARSIWGVSPNFRGPFPELKCIDIDGQAGTFLTRFRDEFKTVAYVQYDPPSVVHRLKEAPETLIIGAGGGKDVLAALSFGAKQVTAVELNPIIVNDIMLKRYKDFTGALYAHSRVKAIAAEGRSYLHADKRRYDVVQLSYVDTSAATSAGAYVLAENSLYTVEAFDEYLSHLNDEGIFSVSWVDVPGLFGGTRLVSLGIAALEHLGVEEVGSRIIVLTHASRPDWVIRNVLLKKSPFTAKEIERITAVCRELGFVTTYLPGRPGDNFISKLIWHGDRETVYRSLPLDISPVTDDRPFFFYQDRFSHFFNLLSQRQLADLTYGVGLRLLGRTLLATFVLTFIFLIAPVALFYRNPSFSFSKSLPYLSYFSCLGLGFMFLEIGLIQRFGLFLGHPFYTLSVTLLSILCFAGLGSLITQYCLRQPPRIYLERALVLLLCVVLCYLWGGPFIFKWFLGYPIAVKIVISFLCLMPLGLLMGMPLPLGIRTLEDQRKTIIPWAWGLNGGMSVLGSVLAITLAMNFGYTATFLIALGIYAMAWGLVRWFL